MAGFLRFKADAAPVRAVWAKAGVRAGVSILALAGFLWLLSDRMAQIDRNALTLAFGQIGWADWGLAFAFTGLSFWAVGHYDAVVHRHFATGLPAAQARRAGICAIAVSQTLGLGLISGAFLRWRMLPGLSLWQATQLTAAVALSFLMGWAVVTALVLVTFPAAPFKGPAGLVLLASALGLALSIWRPGLLGRRWRLPNAFTLGRLFGLCALDSLAAAMALHVLLPAGAEPALALFLPAFLLALGAGLALGTPGGMGAFEVTLLELLPATAEAPLLAGLLAWRAVYYALPALLGAGLALAGPRATPRPRSLTAPGSCPIHPRAETGLAHQGTLRLAKLGDARWLLADTGHCRIGLFDPDSPANLAAALQTFRQSANAEARVPVLYKIGPRMAVVARRNGMAVRRTGWEGWLDPQGFRLAASSRAGLRRKLRRAEAAGIHVQEATPATTPWPELDRIARAWAKAHGGERGFSTGRYDRRYLARQRLFIAWCGDQPLAFASFHATDEEWVLDLIRHDDSLPDGTCYALVMAALNSARAEGALRFSLAAVPEGAICKGLRSTRLLAALAPETAAPGLLRFKSAFAPRWKPLYLAAPGRSGLFIAGLSLWRAICHPPPLPRPAERSGIEQDDAEYGFASAPAPWHIGLDH